MQKKKDIFILEPNLDNRKPLAQLLPLTKFFIKFFSTVEELIDQINERIPHIVVLNLDIKNTDYADVFTIVKTMLPKETYMAALSAKIASKKHEELFQLGLQEIWELPVAGLKIKPRINEIMDERIPYISVKLNSPKPLFSNIKGDIIALGETDFIAQFPVQLSHGDKLCIKSELLTDLWQGEQKMLVITENHHGVVVDNQVTVSVLGLKNDNLKHIRAKILNWDKL